jgi:hypothetical protein
MKKAILIAGLAILIIALGGATLAATPNTMNAGVTGPKIEGTWLGAIPLPDGGTFPSLLTYARGGALIATDSSVPPALGNVYQGTWAKTGPHEFTFTFLGFFYNETGALDGYFRVHETVYLDPGGDSYTSDSIGEILDLDMNVIETLPGSTNYATRIDAE